MKRNILRLGKNMSLELKVGDRVAFNQPYLDLMPQGSQLASAKGTIRALNTTRSSSGHVTLADIEWDQPGPTKRLNIENLDRI